MHALYIELNFSNKIVALAVLGPEILFAQQTCKVAKNGVLKKLEKLRKLGKNGHLEDFEVRQLGEYPW